MSNWTGPKWPNGCTKEVHNRYSKVGPDGKLYPVWHPPVDPSGCFFEHEHGDSTGHLFGYVNEQAFNGPHFHRNEDHVGHKGQVGTALIFNPQNATVPANPVTCDVDAKFHQGTHSPDAFWNNLHEQVTSLRCENGWAFDLQILSAPGKAGTLVKQCPAQEVLVTGPPVPEDSPVKSNPLSPGKSMGTRKIPTMSCIETARPNYQESWQTQNVITRPDGKQGARFAWYWNVSDPSRYWNGKLARTVDQCFRVIGVAFQTISNPCVNLRKLAAGDPIQWDDERSPFKGVQRSVRFNDFTLSNTGPEVWYTDVLGMNPSLTPFPGSVRQMVRGSHPGVYAFTGPNVGGNYNAPGVRAPN
jgi:hypothetical protein